MDLKLKNRKVVPAGTKVIGYNTNLYDELNPYNLNERNDPGKQFAWLQNELQEIEANGGLAIMLAHIDPAGCQHEWGTRFRALTERYQHIIRFGLQGHVHKEFYVVVNSMSNPDKQVLVHSVAGSVVPLYAGNPSFMTLDLDAETLLPVNKHSFSFDLGKANSEDITTWTSHDYLQTYNLTDLSPASMMKMARRSQTDSEFAKMWEKHMHADVIPVTMVKHTSEFCRLVSSEDHERHACNESNGQTVGSKYGTDWSFFSPLGIRDRIIKNWIKTGK